MTTPQILMVGIIVISVISMCATPSPKKAFEMAVCTFIMQGIIYWGGFWE